jgi:hypothetical protein
MEHDAALLPTRPGSPTMNLLDSVRKKASGLMSNIIEVFSDEPRTKVGELKEHWYVHLPGCDGFQVGKWRLTLPFKGCAPSSATTVCSLTGRRCDSCIMIS